MDAWLAADLLLLESFFFRFAHISHNGWSFLVIRTSRGNLNMTLKQRREDGQAFRRSILAVVMVEEDTRMSKANFVTHILVLMDFFFILSNQGIMTLFLYFRRKIPPQLEKNVSLLQPNTCSNPKGNVTIYNL